MPLVVRDATELERPRFLRTLCTAAPKVGKTTTALKTCEGPSFVINSDQLDSLEPALYHVQNFKHVFATTYAEIAEAINIAHSLVQAGKIKTVVWDTVTGFSDCFIEECLRVYTTKDGEEDGRKAWPKYHDGIRNLSSRLLHLECHTIILAHYEDTRTDADYPQPGKPVHKIAKVGGGIVPGLAGKSRIQYGKLFNEVIHMEKRMVNNRPDRVFVTSDAGVWGPGARCLPGVDEMPADFSALIEAQRKADPRLKPGFGKKPASQATLPAKSPTPRASAPAQSSSKPDSLKPQPWKR